MSGLAFISRRARGAGAGAERASPVQRVQLNRCPLCASSPRWATPCGSEGWAWFDVPARYLPPLPRRRLPVSYYWRRDLIPASSTPIVTPAIDTPLTVATNATERGRKEPPGELAHRRVAEGIYKFHFDIVYCNYIVRICNEQDKAIATTASPGGALFLVVSTTSFIHTPKTDRPHTSAPPPARSVP